VQKKHQKKVDQSILGFSKMDKNKCPKTIYKKMDGHKFQEKTTLL
jgi:hypothetical protein